VKNVEVCHEHQAFQQPKEEKLKHKVFLNSNFKGTERNYNNTIIKLSS
jgi:hypothetical protein